MNTSINVDEKTYNQLISGNSIVINHSNKKDESITYELLNKILNENDYYNYLIQAIKNSKGYFTVNLVKDETIINAFSIPITCIVLALLSLDNMSLAKLQKIKSLHELISQDSFIKQSESTDYETNIDGKRKTVDVSMLMYPLYAPKPVYADFLNGKRIITDVSVEEHVYLLKEYVEKNTIFNKWLFDDEVYERYNALISNHLIDYQAINKIVGIKSSENSQIHLNVELKNAVFADMPNGMTKLEQAMYIYMKMCMIFTYNLSYFSNGQMADQDEKYRSLQHLSTLNPQNNEIICYEFNAVYGKFLEQIGLNFEVINPRNLRYGDGHNNLQFRSEKYLVDVDSVTSIFNGDLINIKLGIEPNGIKCCNMNSHTQLEFNRSLKKIWKLFNNKKFLEIITNYEKSCMKQEMNLYSKFDYLMSNIYNSNLTGIDVFGLIVKLKRHLFTSSELKEKISLAVINMRRQNKMKPFMVFTLGNDIKHDISSNIYICYYPPKKFVITSLEKLQEYFDNDIFEYVFGETHQIPGISIGRKTQLRNLEKIAKLSKKN